MARSKHSLRIQPSLGSTKPKGGFSIMHQTLVCVVLSIVLITVSSRLGDASPLIALRSAVQTIMLPFQLTGALVTSPFQATGNVLSNLTASQETLSDLKAQNEQLKSRTVELEEAQQTAERLQSLLNLQDTYKLQSTAARIVSGSTDSWTSTVTIDKGSADGLAVGMPVTDSSGAIGQITSVAAHTAVVKLITDETSGVSAMVQSSRAQGILSGSAAGILQLKLIRTTQKVQVGDTIVTSGLGGIFPKGLPLGTVSSVESTAGALYYTITVDTSLHAETNEEVLVITSLTEEQQATSEDIAEADAQEKSSSTTTDDATTDDASTNETTGDGTTTSKTTTDKEGSNGSNT